MSVLHWGTFRSAGCVVRMRFHGRCLSDSLKRGHSPMSNAGSAPSPRCPPSLASTTACTLASSVAGLLERLLEFGEVRREWIAKGVDRVVDVGDRPIRGAP